MDKTWRAMKQIEKERTKMAVGDDKLRTELQSGTMLEAKTMDDGHHMNICDKVHNVTDSSKDINAEDFVDSVINFGSTGEGEDDDKHHDEEYTAVENDEHVMPSIDN